MNGSDVISSRWSITREINRQANDIRQRLGAKLRRAAEQGFLVISPDLWSDKYKQNNYLGLTAHFVDDHHALHVIDLCCEPYNEMDKRAPSIRKVGNNTKSFFLFIPFFFFIISFNKQLHRLSLSLESLI
jgi:hypothetical protein